MVKNHPANEGDTGDLGSIPGLGRSPDRKWQRTPVFLPGKSHRQKSLVGTVHGVLQRSGHIYAQELIWILSKFLKTYQTVKIFKKISWNEHINSQLNLNLILNFTVCLLYSSRHIIEIFWEVVSLCDEKSKWWRSLVFLCELWNIGIQKVLRKCSACSSGSKKNHLFSLPFCEINLFSNFSSLINNVHFSCS